MNFINNVIFNEIAPLDILMYFLITKIVESHLENFKKRRKKKSKGRRKVEGGMKTARYKLFKNLYYILDF